MNKLEDNLKNETMDEIQTSDGIVELKGNDKILTLSIDDILISGIIVNKNEYPYPALTFIYSNPNFRNKGYMKKVLKEYTKRYGKLMSDNIHSKDAEHMWKSMIKNKTSEFKINAINTSTNEISDIGNKNNPWSIDPWKDDDNGEIRLVFENKEEKLKKLMESKPTYDFDGNLGIILDNNL